MTERFSFADMVILAVERFANYIPLDVKSVFTWYMEQKGVENPERFIQQVPQIPQEIQNILMQQPDVQQMIQEVEERKIKNVQPIEQETPQEELESLAQKTEANI